MLSIYKMTGSKTQTTYDVIYQNGINGFNSRFYKKPKLIYLQIRQLLMRKVRYLDKHIYILYNKPATNC